MITFPFYLVICVSMSQNLWKMYQKTIPSNTQVEKIIMMQEGNSVVITWAEDKNNNYQEYNK